MFAYLLLFMVLTYISVKNDIDNHYPVFYVFLGSFAYVAFNAGIVLYAVSYQNEAIKAAWRYLFPYLVAYFVTSFIVDSVFGAHADLSPIGILLDLSIFVLGTGIFFPAFRASFFLAYRNLRPIPQE